MADLSNAPVLRKLRIEISRSSSSESEDDSRGRPRESMRTASLGYSYQKLGDPRRSSIRWHCASLLSLATLLAFVLNDLVFDSIANFWGSPSKQQEFGVSLGQQTVSVQRSYYCTLPASFHVPILAARLGIPLAVLGACVLRQMFFEKPDVSRIVCWICLFANAAMFVCNLKIVALSCKRTTGSDENLSSVLHMHLAMAAMILICLADEIRRLDKVFRAR
jgi:hypothetical protein